MFFYNIILGVVDSNGAQTIINARNGGIQYVDGNVIDLKFFYKFYWNLYCNILIY